MREHVDEVRGLHGALSLIELAFLRLAHVGVVLLTHQWILHRVLEGVREKTSMAAPGVVVAIEDLLSGKTD